jgi:apolipoprotein N-acyltransferase
MHIGWWFGFGWFQAGTYWLYICLVGNGGVPLWLAAVLMLGLTSLMGSYNAFLGRFVAYSIIHSPCSMWLKLCLMVSGLTAVEYFRAWFLSGFPWLALGYSGLDTPLQALAPVTGVYGMSVVLYAFAVALGLGGVATLRSRQWWIAVLAAVVGSMSLSTLSFVRPVGNALSVAMVQGAIPQDEKWQQGREAEITGRYIGLTESALGADLIVWPESSLPYLYQDAERLLSSLNALAKLKHSTLILGLIHAQAGNYYNGIAVLGEPVQWADKRHLVPFGEYFPVPGWVRQWMRLANLPYTDFTPGSEPQPLLYAKGQALASTVCYEDAFNEEQRSNLDHATLLVNVTNDTWFGDSTAPHQHLQISRMRALEAGRYLIRAANSGISAVIGPDGSVRVRSAQFEPMVLQGQVIPLTGMTPFARFGNAPVLVLIVLPWLLLTGMRLFRRIQPKR